MEVPSGRHSGERADDNATNVSGIAQRIWRKQPVQMRVRVDLGGKVEKLLTFSADECDWQLAGLPARAVMWCEGVA